MTFVQRLGAAAGLIEQRLTELLAECGPEEGGRLNAAMRHALLGGGKRFRPFLVIESAGLFGIEAQAALDAAAAFECVHCYSLVHDDLPSMDNDDVRRGQPTVHKAFDEWTAILAGDALLTLAFEILARPQTNADPGVRAELTRVLARAAGRPRHGARADARPRSGEARRAAAHDGGARSAVAEPEDRAR